MEAETHRDSRIRAAALSSLFSKGGTFLLQIVALPLAIRALGPERFGIYAAVTSTFALLSFADFGIGPSVVRGVARAQAEGRPDDARRVFSVALALVAGLVALGAAILLAIAFVVPVDTWLGASFAPFSGEIRSAVGLGVLLIGLQMIAAVAARAQAGCQEMHIGNLSGGLGNVLGAVAVASLAVTSQITIVSLVAAVIGGSTCASVVNAWLFLRRHPELAPRWFGLRGNGLRILAMDSGGFAIAAVLVPFLQREGAKLVMARTGGPFEVGRLALLQQLAMYVAGLVVIYTGPLMPAIADAAGRGDLQWLHRTRERVYWLWLAVAAASVLGGVLWGSFAIRTWVGTSFAYTSVEFGLFFGSFALVLWAHVNYVFLGALGCIWQVAWTLLAEVVAALGLAAVLLPRFGLSGFFAASALMALFTSAWVLPRAVDQRFRGIGEVRE